MTSTIMSISLQNADNCHDSVIEASHAKCMRTLIGCFLLLFAAVAWFQDYRDAAFYAGMFGVILLLPSRSNSDSSIGISFGDSDGGGGCGGD